MERRKHYFSKNEKYYLAALLGAIAGGLIVAWATNALPKMTSAMMQNMKALMGGENCNPVEM